MSLHPILGACLAALAGLQGHSRASANAIAGAAAGVLVSVCLHPIDTLKVLIQSQVRRATKQALAPRTTPLLRLPNLLSDHRPGPVGCMSFDRKYSDDAYFVGRLLDWRFPGKAGYQRYSGDTVRS